MTKKKQRLYADLLDRLKAAREASYHYEACWFAHAVFEDRTRSIVANSGDGTGHGGTISNKLTTILERFDATVAKVLDRKAVRDKKTGNKQKNPKWPNLRTFDRQLVEDVQSGQRNAMTWFMSLRRGS